VLRVLAGLRRLRGTWLDPFGYSGERRMERELIGEYRRLIDELVQTLTPERYETAVKLAELPLLVRGFGPIKRANVAAARERQAELLAAYAATE
jgi:indolepyruvate ferredoxin oxidoreductase